MLDELGITKEECLNIKEMMTKSLEYLKIKQEEDIVPKNLDYVVGIEGCDYIDPSDLKYFYNNFHQGIMMDVSHANEKTFNDILDVYSKNNNPNKIIIAYHSNVRSLCNEKRNLTDNQLNRLKEVNGYIGLFSNCSFVFKDFRDKSYEYRI